MMKKKKSRQQQQRGGAKRGDSSSSNNSNTNRTSSSSNNNSNNNDNLSAATATTTTTSSRTDTDTTSSSTAAGAAQEGSRNNNNSKNRNSSSRILSLSVRQTDSAAYFVNSREHQPPSPWTAAAAAQRQQQEQDASASTSAASSGAASASSSNGDNASSSNVHGGGGGGGGVNALDKQTHVMKWISQGRLDSKNLAKRFPHTARDLQQGIVTPENLTRHILQLAGMKLSKNYQEKLSGECDRMTLFVLPPKLRTTSRALPSLSSSSSSSTETNTNSNKNQQASGGSGGGGGSNIQRLFSYALLKNIADRSLRKAGDPNWNDEVQIRQALRQTCEMFSTKIDKMMGSKKGTFLKTCLVYNKTQQEFNKDIIPHVLDQAENTFSQLLHAAEGIAYGQLGVERSCWECGKETSKKLSTCGHCVVARYCSSECQTKAWKSGHRQKCPSLAAKNEMLLESLQAIDDRHNDESLASVTPKTPDLDYKILNLFIQFPSPFQGSELDGKLKGPSMKYFYENVDRIISGYWWFFPKEECLSLKEYDKRLRKVPNYEQKELQVLADLMCFLAFDYVQYSREGDPQFRAPDDYFFKVLFHQNPFSITKRIQQSSFGMAMPAKRFLNLYLGDNTTPHETRRKNSTKRQWKGTVQVAFREKYHK